MAKGLAGSIERAIRRSFDSSDKGEILRLLKNPPQIIPNRIVFTSSDDYTGNPQALYEKMVDLGLNKKYEIIWLFEKRDNYFEFEDENVSSVNMFNEDGTRTAEAQQAIMSSRYIFFSHNVNWVKKFQPGQTFVNLWHGCGYKGNKPSDSRKIKSDYYVVVGPEYVDVFEKMFDLDRKIILPLGYPRNEKFFTEASSARSFVASAKSSVSADKVIAWMPTFRKSTVERLDEASNIGETGLPLVGTFEELKALDEYCREKNVLILLKRHHLQKKYEQSGELSNIIYLGNDDLKKENVELYELLANTDSLLSDYSSVAIDYMLLDKPIGYIVDDFDEYSQNREWCLDKPKDYMAGHQISTMAELKDYISDIAAGKDLHKEKRRAIRKEVHVENSNYSESILKWFKLI